MKLRRFLRHKGNGARRRYVGALERLSSHRMLAGNLNRRFNMLRGFLLYYLRRNARGPKGSTAPDQRELPDRVLVPPRNYHRPTYVRLGWVQLMLEVSYWREIAFGAPNPSGTSEVAVAPMQRVVT